MIKTALKKIVISILEWEAQLILKKYKPKVIGVTGNIGKTSTKDAIATVLSKRFDVRKSEKSYNSEIGIPLTILGVKSGWSNPFTWIKNIIEGLLLILFKAQYPEWLVIEIGADRPGDIENTISWLKLTVGVVTYVGDLPVHVEFFSSQKALVREKTFVATAPGPTGLVILNQDNQTVLDMQEKVRAPVLTFGFDDRATIQASNEHITYKDGLPDGVTFKVDYKGKSVPIRISGVVGKHIVYTVLPAILVGAYQGMNLVEIIDALQEYMPPGGRSRLVSGLKGSMIIDDTYNSSPHALEAALRCLEEIDVSGKKIAVLGDMMELGKYTIDAHTAAGEHAAKTVDTLYLVGQRARFIAEGAKAAGMKSDQIFLYDDSQKAGEDLQNKLRKGDVVLAKGSQYVRMEKAVKEIMAHPEDAEKLLVRQDKEWLNR